MEEEQYLLNKTERNANNTNESVSDGEWSGESSDSSSYYSDTDSSVPEWDSFIEESGELFFIDCHPIVTQTNQENESKNINPLAKTSTRKSTRGKFLRLIRRRDSKRRSKRFQKTNESSQENKVTFQDYGEGEIKKVTLKFDCNSRLKFGRRAKLTESILGLNVSTFSDGIRIMIAGFTNDGEAKNDKNIKIGDWLKNINGNDITAQNLNTILEQLTGDEVTLELQRVNGVEVTKQPPNNELSNQSNFVKLLTGYEENYELIKLFLEESVGVLYLDTEKLTESGPEFEGVIYCYPPTFQKNSLCTSRGVFITINHLIFDITKNNPQITSVILKEKLIHIVYNNYGGNLLLFMFPDHRITNKEILIINEGILRILLFIYGSVDNIFRDDNRNQLDHFFSRFFARVLSNEGEQNIITGKFGPKEAKYQFEDFLPVAHFLPLPNEAQMQIDDALSELEACDYREWNEDPLDCQRLFTILGSALYHSGFLLASHFIHGDLIDVHLYCKHQGLFHLSKTEPVRSLVLWKEIFPFSCNRDGTKFTVPDNSRRYLLIVGSGKDILVVLMEAGGCTEPPEDNLGPDAFYVEEAQATLAHLQELGITELAERWSLSNPGTQVTIPRIPTSKRKTDFLGNFSKSMSPSKDNSPINKKQLEVTSILKRRSSDQGPLSQSGSLFSIPDDTEVHSEDSVSQGGYSERSEVSDEPVIGRRALRERNKNNFDGSDEEESDIDDYRDGSQISNSSYDLSELRQSLLNETGEIQPAQITAGNDLVLYHYVSLDFTEGILLSPPECRLESKTLDLILNNFRRSCLNIHKIFENTLRFKNMSAQEMAKSLMNKSLIAIKEYGMLFETCYQDEGTKKSVKIEYWVIGKLFYMPHPREVYVCYQNTIPQNLIEIAFRLGISLIN